VRSNQCYILRLSAQYKLTFETILYTWSSSLLYNIQSGIRETSSLWNSKAVPLHAMEAHGGKKVQLLLILNLGTRWGDGGEWSASRPGRALPPGKEPPVPIG
jgi:hypothetical protein